MSEGLGFGGIGGGTRKGLSPVILIIIVVITFTALRRIPALKLENLFNAKKK